MLQNYVCVTILHLGGGNTKKKGPRVVVAAKDVLGPKQEETVKRLDD